MTDLEKFLLEAAGFIWGVPLLILLLGGGLFFLIYSRFLPFRYFRHAVAVLTGKYEHPDDPGQLNHFQALSGALAATIGMGNISGVAVAIAVGGPGAIFWMWTSAFLGMATKFFTCSLAVMYRGRDSAGELQGGPMYFIQEGLGRKWRWLAIFFALAGTFGATPVFQANQMVVAAKELLSVPEQVWGCLSTDLLFGLLFAILVAMVVLGGIRRIGRVAGSMVPAMVLIYILSVSVILLFNAPEVPSAIALIFRDAFTAESTMGGALGALIVTGARRAAFSNEAGVGTAPLMHGAAKTSEPIREGLVAMLGPAIDTLIVCTMTGLCILVTGAWKQASLSGISLTNSAFEHLPFGSYILSVCVLIFGLTTIFGFAYYGKKCFSYLVGTRLGQYFDYWYIALVVVGSMATLDVVVAVIDLAYGLMAFPTMIGAIALSPRVIARAKEYFKSLRH